MHVLLRGNFRMKKRNFGLHVCAYYVSIRGCEKLKVYAEDSGNPVVTIQCQDGDNSCSHLELHQVNTNSQQLIR